MAQFIKIREERINLDRVNHYYVRKTQNSICVSKVPHLLIITFEQNDKIRFQTEDEQEFES